MTLRFLTRLKGHSSFTFLNLSICLFVHLSLCLQNPNTASSKSITLACAHWPLCPLISNNHAYQLSGLFFATFFAFRLGFYSFPSWHVTCKSAPARLCRIEFTKIVSCGCECVCVRPSVHMRVCSVEVRAYVVTTGHWNTRGPLQSVSDKNTHEADTQQWMNWIVNVNTSLLLSAVNVIKCEFVSSTVLVTGREAARDIRN